MAIGANTPVPAANSAWHALPADDVMKHLATSVDKGRDAGEAGSRLQKYGPNRLPEGKTRPPRAVDRPILTGFGIWRVIFVGLALVAFTLWAFFWMKGQGASDELARTVAVNAITIGQIYYLLNSRFLLDSSLTIAGHKGNKYLPMGIGAVIVLQLLFTYAPPLQAVFGNEAIPLHVWPILIAGGAVFFLVVEFEKFIIRSNGSLKRAVTAVEAGS